MSDGHNGGGGEENPFAGKDLKGLLQWTIKQGVDVNETATMGIDEEKRAFFENAMKAFTMDEMDLVKACFEVVKNHPLMSVEGSQISAEEVSSDSDVINSLQRLCEVVDNIDNAMNLKNFDWISVFRILLKKFSEKEGKSQTTVISLACEVIAISASNDEKMQLECQELLPSLLAILRANVSKEGSETVMLKALYALSSIIQENADTSATFIALKGNDIVGSLTNQYVDRMGGEGNSVEVVKMLTKSLVLLKNLSLQQPSILSQELLANVDNIFGKMYDCVRAQESSLLGVMLTCREILLRLLLRFKECNAMESNQREVFKAKCQEERGFLKKTYPSHADALLEELELLDMMSE
eukprot:Nk52_evm15s2011 gene=Nk52_evmTU15s2011